jgi:hypothetical protein
MPSLLLKKERLIRQKLCPEFTIHVGDELEVLETGEHFYIKQ